MPGCSQGFYPDCQLVSRFQGTPRLARSLDVPVNSTDPVLLGFNSEVVGVKYPNYDAFYGLPFAKPPLGKLRFANPIPARLPRGRFVADTVPPPCPQPTRQYNLSEAVKGSEDCLYLNIYRPKAQKSQTRLPVLFYIFGGAYFAGSASPSEVGPSYFMENGSVILVVPQYRLNTLGFLATGDSASPGNYGMKDQVAALKWVKRNIRAFGGDPEAITVLGQSFGSSSVLMLTMSPLSRNLMRGAIGLSDTAIMARNYPTLDPLSLARKHAMVLNVENAETMSSFQLVEEFRKLPADQIISSVKQLKYMGTDPVTLYRPVVEPPGTRGAFMTESPYEMMTKENFVKVPVLYSNVQNEYALSSYTLARSPMKRMDFNARTDTLIAFLLELRMSLEADKRFTEEIKLRYNLTNGITDEESVKNLNQMFNERLAYFPTYRALQLHLKNSPQVPVYYQEFYYDGQFSNSDLNSKLKGEDLGVVHKDDLIYMFNSKSFSELNEQDKAASREYVNYLVQFVIDQRPPGNPQCKELKPMCPYLRFFKNKETGAFDSELTREYPIESVKFWDRTGEIPL